MIEAFESEIRNRIESGDERIAPAQQLYRGCVARYIAAPDETLLVCLKDVIEILKNERLTGSQEHLLEEARSLLGMVYLKLDKKAKAKDLLSSSFNSLQSMANPKPQTNQAIIDAGKRLSHFYMMTNASDDAERIDDSIKTIESNVKHIPAFTRELIDRTLTTTTK